MPQQGIGEKAFRPKYGNCGNRNQLDPSGPPPIVERNVRGATPRASKIAVADVDEAVEADLEELNRDLVEGPKVVRKRARDTAPNTKARSARRVDLASPRPGPCEKEVRAGGQVASASSPGWTELRWTTGKWISQPSS